MGSNTSARSEGRLPASSLPRVLSLASMAGTMLNTVFLPNRLSYNNTVLHLSRCTSGSWRLVLGRHGDAQQVRLSRRDAKSFRSREADRFQRIERLNGEYCLQTRAGRPRLQTANNDTILWTGILVSGDVHEHCQRASKSSSSSSLSVSHAHCTSAGRD